MIDGTVMTNIFIPGSSIGIINEVDFSILIKVNSMNTIFISEAILCSVKLSEPLLS